jgi:deoxycytidylate deaminase
MESGQLSYECHHEWSKSNEVHAEINAIQFARNYGLTTNDATLYVTHSPCKDCAEQIVNTTKIRRVVYIERYDGSEQIEKFLSENNIEVTRFDVSLNTLRGRGILTKDLFKPESSVHYCPNCQTEMSVNEPDHDDPVGFPPFLKCDKCKKEIRL